MFITALNQGKKALLDFLQNLFWAIVHRKPKEPKNKKWNL